MKYKKNCFSCFFYEWDEPDYECGDFGEHDCIKPKQMDKIFNQESSGKYWKWENWHRCYTPDLKQEVDYDN